MMEIAFSYDRPVTGRQFLGRKSDCEQLRKAILAGENIALYAAPKGGKTSLISQVLLQLEQAGEPVSFCKVPAGNAIRIEDFVRNLYLRFCEALNLSADPSLLKVAPGQDFCGRIMMEMARLACDRPLGRVLIQIEDFQRLDSLENSAAFMRAFRDMLQATRASVVGYVLTGSQLNAMKALFLKSPFFKDSVRTLTLSRIEDREIYEYVRRNFDVTGKVMERADIEQVIRMLEGNIWYIKHYMSLCDSMTRGYINAAVMSSALAALVSSQLPYFQYIASNLTCFQLRFLKALIDNGPRCNFSSARIMKDYGLNSSANIVRVRDALLKKEIITRDGKGDWRFIDPLLRYWFRHYFFQ